MRTSLGDPEVPPLDPAETPAEYECPTASGGKRRAIKVFFLTAASLALGLLLLVQVAGSTPEPSPLSFLLHTNRATSGGGSSSTTSPSLWDSSAGNSQHRSRADISRTWRASTSESWPPHRRGAHAGSRGARRQLQGGGKGKAAMKAVIDALQVYGYSKYLSLLNTTGFIPNLEEVLDTYQVTFLAPCDRAFELADSSVAERLKSLATAKEIVAYHVLAGRTPFASVETIKLNTEFATADYNLAAAKLFTYVPQFGAPGTTRGSRIVAANIYLDSQVSVQGVDRIMVPPKFFAK